MAVYLKGETYYIHNKGVGDEKLFKDKEDYARFLFLILYFQSPLTFTNLNRPVGRFLEKGRFGIRKDVRTEVCNKRFVEPLLFSIVPKEFHIVIFNKKNGALSTYMRRIQNSYAKYYNTKYNREGHVFKGTFKAHEIEDYDAMLHISSYVHKAPRDLASWKDRFNTYPWSSFKDYHTQNRWGHLLSTHYILDQFPTRSLYERYVETSLPRGDIKEMLGL